MPITKWNPQRVREAALDELQANAEIVGKFVEEDARRRLYAITDPTWGEKYRRLIVGRLLTNVVEREARAVVITVGVRGGEKGRYYGLYIETGTKRHPAHPFLRPAVFENARQIVALLAGR
jgi:hypothetical protein